MLLQFLFALMVPSPAEKMSSPKTTTTSDAADIVLRERARLREESKKPSVKDAEPVSLETVSVVSQRPIDESELDRRHRDLAQKLEKRQIEVEKQGQALARVRKELKALEQPMKEEIMKLREKLEDANRRETVLVTSVNDLRKDLKAKEGHLAEVRKEKQGVADELIQVMADYERRKTERLNEIAEIVGAEGVKPKERKGSRFSGF